MNGLTFETLKYGIKLQVTETVLYILPFKLEEKMVYWTYHKIIGELWHEEDDFLECQWHSCMFR